MSLSHLTSYGRSGLSVSLTTSTLKWGARAQGLAGGGVRTCQFRKDERKS
jgi:hypothetical protein